jgi:FxsC-like protein
VPAYWFFLSYARRDLERSLKKLFKELGQSVGVLVGEPAEQVAFLDTSDIKEGEEWPHQLVEGLQGCRVFVPLYSPSYFTSDYCGKEWAAFRARQDAATAGPGAVRPPLIMPLLWVAPDQLPASLPEEITDLQQLHGEPGVYRQLGLRQLLRLGKHADTWRELIDGFAQRLVERAKAHALPALPTPPSIKEIVSAWKRPPAPAAAPAQPLDTRGPRFVQFIFVAGRREELQALRDVAPYGGEGGDWKPFLPDVEDEIEMVAQQITVGERLRYEHARLGADLIQRIEAAERDNKIVAVIVDTWTLQIEPYSGLMRAFDKRNFLNCVILVPWNEKDTDTSQNRAALEQTVQAVFLRRTLAKDPSSFLDSIRSPDDFTKNLTAALHVARSRIVNSAEVQKKAQGAFVIGRPVL